MKSNYQKKLIKLRNQKKYTQKDMAEQIGISESYYCQLEKGKRRMSMDLALKISSILGKTPNDIFLPNNFTDRKAE